MFEYFKNVLENLLMQFTTLTDERRQNILDIGNKSDNNKNNDSQTS